MDKNETQRKGLMSQMALYWKREKPFDIPYSFNEYPTTWWCLIEDALPIEKEH
ncbi:2994_t:CDS:1, partial [Entrophospora sp. SA101]